MEVIPCNLLLIDAYQVVCLRFCKFCMLAPWHLYSLKHYLVYFGTRLQNYFKGLRSSWDKTRSKISIVNKLSNSHVAEKLLQFVHFDLICILQSILKSRGWTFKLIPFISSLIIAVVHYFSSNVMWKIWAVPPKLPLSQTRVPVGCWLIVYNISGGNKHPEKNTNLQRLFLVQLGSVEQKKGEMPPSVNHQYISPPWLHHGGQNSL